MIDKKLFFIFLFFCFPMNASVVYLSVLQNKEKPQRIIILLADIHNFNMQLEDIQKKATDKLLAQLKDLPKNIILNFLFECTLEDIKFLKKESFEEFSKKDLIEYLWILHAHEKIPLNIAPIACDIRNLTDSILTYIGNQIFRALYPDGNYNSFRTWKAEASELECKQTEYLEWYRKNAEQVGIKDKGPVYVSTYRERLNELEKQVNVMLEIIPSNYRNFLRVQFSKSIDDAKEILSTFKAVDNDNIARFAVKIIEQSPSYNKACSAFTKLQKPSQIAADIGMLQSLLKNKPDANISILFAGLNHILNIEDILRNNYTIIKQFDLVWNIQAKNGVPSFTAPSEEETLQISHDIIQLIKKIFM